jgi:prepilin-type N-terminal cleavage/methylation domain-containing protein
VSSSSIRRRTAFTLVEIAVVLVLIGLMAALVAPAFVPRRPVDDRGLAAVVRTARGAAIRRGETIGLRVDPGGQWELVGQASKSDGPLAAGRLPVAPGTALALDVSPLGTCAPGVDSASAALASLVDPFTCEVRPR